MLPILRLKIADSGEGAVNNFFKLLGERMIVILLVILLFD